MFLDHDDDKQHASDTLHEAGKGIADGAEKVGDAIKEDAAQTKDDVQDLVRGEDGNNN